MSDDIKYYLVYFIHIWDQQADWNGHLDSDNSKLMVNVAIEGQRHNFHISKPKSVSEQRHMLIPFIYEISLVYTM